MKRQIFTTVFLLTGLFLQAQNFQNIDTTKSEVKFSVLNMKVKTVEGSFKGMKGEILFDINDLSHSFMKVCISAKSIDTGNNKRDKHLRSDDFFNVEKYPVICFESQKIEKYKNAYKVTGLLNLHGISKRVEIPFSHKDDTFSGTFTINRKDFDLGGNGTFMVADEIAINIICKTK
ncbi:MAG: YceI family protein [Carboxylicivirga sp.]|nr:YceI family protein [Carboxylicivirga sp.]